MADTDKIEETPVEEQAPAATEAGENEEVPTTPIDERARSPSSQTGPL